MPRCERMQPYAMGGSPIPPGNEVNARAPCAPEQPRVLAILPRYELGIVADHAAERWQGRHEKALVLNPLAVHPHWLESRFVGVVVGPNAMQVE